MWENVYCTALQEGVKKTHHIDPPMVSSCNIVSTIENAIFFLLDALPLF